MSGHSKWASIKHKKAVVDARRGKLFTRLIREIMIAARTGGTNPDSNSRLRMAIDKAREYNMPSDNIKRAIQKGGGEDGENQLEEIAYEGYGPGGVAVKVEVVTDNKRRTASEIRSIFIKNNGSLGELGCVSWIFERRGQITVAREGVDEEDFFLKALEAGAEDVVSEAEEYLVYAQPADLDKVCAFLAERQVTIKSSGFNLVPKNTVPVEGKDAEHLLRLLDTLEENDDVQAVYANFDIADKVLEDLERSAGQQTS